MNLKLQMVSFLSAIAVGCGGPTSVSSNLTSAEQEDMSKRLALLDATLEEHVPFILAKLAPPATDEDLAELWAGLGGSHIQSLELWYRWHNGCTDNKTDLLPLGRMLSISEALADRKAIQTIPFVDAKRRGALKILEDLAGDGYFLDVTSSRPRVFYQMLEDPWFPRDYGPLKDFVQFLVDVHAAGISSQDKYGMVDFDPKEYDRIESTYLRNLTK